ncbi:MAG: tRNA (uridine(34)/cytosine(34)/5-carboxymethylaminomethyluridine(34)-2'-O)-methyltransferase TrmL [Clostridiales bacterium]
MSINIVLVEPEIPQNTGNIVRLCVATNSKLHLIKPFGFSVSDKHLKRAGLDYWNLAEINYYESLKDFFDKNKSANLFYSTTKAANTYTSMEYKENPFILFGKESKGLPEELVRNNEKNSIRIPIAEKMRSLNLSNSVAIVVYEILKQDDFKGLVKKGNLTKHI